MLRTEHQTQNKCCQQCSNTSELHCCVHVPECLAEISICRMPSRSLHMQSALVLGYVMQSQQSMKKKTAGLNSPRLPSLFHAGNFWTFMKPLGHKPPCSQPGTMLPGSTIDMIICMHNKPASSQCANTIKTKPTNTMVACTRHRSTLVSEPIAPHHHIPTVIP